MAVAPVTPVAHVVAVAVAAVAVAPVAVAPMALSTRNMKGIL